MINKRPINLNLEAQIIHTNDFLGLVNMKDLISDTKGLTIVFTKELVFSPYFYTNPFFGETYIFSRVCDYSSELDSRSYPEVAISDSLTKYFVNVLNNTPDDKIPFLEIKNPCFYMNDKSSIPTLCWGLNSKK